MSPSHPALWIGYAFEIPYNITINTILQNFASLRMETLPQFDIIMQTFLISLTHLDAYNRIN